MATIIPVVGLVKSWRDNANTYTYAAMNTTDTVGEAVEQTGAAHRSVQVFGTFGAGGTVTIQGSNDGTNWATLTDPQGNALTFTTAKIEAVQELTRYIRPASVAGDGTTNLTVIILLRRES